MSTRPRAFTLIELPAVRQRGFTLIELLVVVTIIVVLLALLTPALDKAIYQAELAVCAAKLRATASGALAYTGDFKRRYPYRKLSVPYWNRQCYTLQDANAGDDRPTLKGYFELKGLLDPLTGKVDLADPRPVVIWTSYAMWFGFGYFPSGTSERAMNKLGDRFTWTDALTNPGSPVTYSFGLLASDLDQIHTPGIFYGSHPDRGGVSSLRTYDNDNRSATYTWWTTAASDGGAGTSERGPVDLNFAYADGSVLRQDAVAWDEWRQGGRMVRTPDYPNGAYYADRRIQLPKP